MDKFDEIIEKIAYPIINFLNKVSEWDKKLNKCPILKAFIAPISKILLSLGFVLLLLFIFIIVCGVIFGLLNIIFLIFLKLPKYAIIIIVYLIWVRRCYKKKSSLGID